MQALEIVVVLLTTVLLLSWVARRLGIGEPVVLLCGGVLIGLIPHFHAVHLPSDLVLLIFLPPLLYSESLTISLHQIRANLRVIMMLSIGLVLSTALSVAGTGYALGMAWPVAFVLGTVLAPTDATAVAAVAKGMPRRTLTTMRAESLINDGTALVLFAVAVDSASGAEAFSWGGVVWRFVLSYVGGAAIGAAGAGLVVLIRRRLHDPVLESGLSVLTPFAVYLPAELADVSGVLAVVVCGLIISWASPLLIPANSRMQTFAFWDLASFLLNGALFVLVGVQLPSAVRGLTSLGPGQAILLAAAVSGTVIATRLVFLHTTPYLIRALDRRPQQRSRRVGARQRMPIAWGGVRGAVSLAAALAVPTTMKDGGTFHDRDVIVFVTAVVIVVTLLVQGETLPALIRWSRLPADPSEDQEELLARRHTVRAAMKELESRAELTDAPADVVARLRRELEEHADEVGAAEDHDRQLEHELRQAILRAKRGALVSLRNSRRIDDSVLRRVQETLDAEEVRLALRISAAHAVPVEEPAEQEHEEARHSGHGIW
ncbi:Na+/H+ antiporter [Streptomyces sp. NBC_01476]|uniref:Na+/H+ antiporter n=1 Tax=Streptomyces sp. NBC_01476 TaxID=2903881 RepID=UPI002E2F5039|nr:Na+/H+ antiporter [Streptomyces sp. NBC_01476]